MEIVVEGKTRKLVFKDTHLEDAGEITCRTNQESSSCQLKVACKITNLSSTSHPLTPPHRRERVCEGDGAVRGRGGEGAGGLSRGGQGPR